MIASFCSIALVLQMRVIMPDKEQTA